MSTLAVASGLLILWIALVCNVFILSPIKSLWSEYSETIL